MSIFSLLSFLTIKHPVLAFLVSASDWTKFWYVMHLSIAFTMIIPLVVGYYVRKKLDRGLRLLMLNLLIAFIVELLAFGLPELAEYVRFIPEENFFIYSLFTPVEFVLFVLMFRFWNSGKAFDRVLTFSIPVFVVIWLVGMFSVISDAMSAELISNMATLEAVKRNVWQFENYLLSAESVFFIICALVTLLTGLKDLEHSILMSGMFWVSAAILVYYSGSLFVFTLMDLILESEKSFWYIHSAVNLLKNILYAIGLYYSGKYALKSSASQGEDAGVEGT
ncbi:hypothetical protein KQI65_01695 [bacterium]|nr:hypothetical protein [bacterium]